MRIFKRVVLIVFGIVIGCAAILAGSVVLDGLIGRDRIEDVTNTRIPGLDGGPDVRAFVAAPPGDGPFPVVIMIHEFFGLNRSIVGKAQGLAEAGYLVVAPDTFRGSTTEWIPRAIYQTLTTPPEQINQDLDAVFAWIADRPDAESDRVGIVGFCYGGRASLAYSLHNRRLAATVIFYGSPETDPQVLQALTAPVLGIFGGADSSIPTERIRAFDAALDRAGIPNEITIYPDQPHAFVTDIESIRAGGVQGQAWAQMLEFLNQNLQQGDGTAPEIGPSAAYRPPYDWGYYLSLVYEHAFGSKLHHP